MSKVAIIMPSMDTENREYWQAAVDSIADQTFPTKDILLIQVVRFNTDLPFTRLTHRKIGQVITISYSVKPETPITDMAQMAVGFKRAVADIGVDYIMMTPANDLLGPTIVADYVNALENNPKAMVAYCDHVMFSDAYPLRKTFKLHDAIVIEDMTKQNHVPDYSMFRADMYRDIPFDAQYLRVSYWVWWIKVLQKYGPDAFVHVPKPNFHYRWGHEGQTSQDSTYKDEGAAIMTQWLKDRKLIADTIMLHY